MGKAKKLAAPRPNLANGFVADRDTVRAEPLILIVAPTRELCCQIFDECRRLCYRSMLRPCVAYGGAPVREQKEELSKGCDILVATPGRLLDFMAQPHILSMARVRYTIIDEADEMLHDDWETEMATIMSGGGKYSSLPFCNLTKSLQTSMKMAIIVISSSPLHSIGTCEHWPDDTSTMITSASALVVLVPLTPMSSRMWVPLLTSSEANITDQLSRSSGLITRRRRKLSTRCLSLCRRLELWSS
jgi:hypothetical protein